MGLKSTRSGRDRRTSIVKVTICKITQIELLGCESLAGKTHHLPQVSCRGIEAILLVGLILEQITIDDKLEYLNIGPVSDLNVAC